MLVGESAKGNAMSSVREVLTANLAMVEQRLAAACARAGRRRDQVKLVAVTKSVSVEVAALLPELGVLDLGESRPQELWRKSELLPKSARWHMIGHLQRNKIERTLPLVHLIHSVDSERLLGALDAVDVGRPVEVLLEFNCGGESSKSGFPPEQAPALAPLLNKLKRVRIAGLMTMAPYEETPEKCRPVFARLRRLLEQLRREVGSAHPLPELSMGMSNDFEVAVEEGATLVRLGTILFTGLPAGEGA
jgi:pyridoxal phosphate enzyme (YggS family)